MADFILTTASTLMCPHGGSVQLSTSNSQVKVDGSPALLLTDRHTVSGCPFQIPVGAGTKAQPCTSVQWLVGATQTLVGGVPVLLQSSVGLCLSAEQIPQGPPSVSQVQQVVKGS
jgi:uncharacterized Zn-binding protein involved in type VI secretion